MNLPWVARVRLDAAQEGAVHWREVARLHASARAAETLHLNAVRQRLLDVEAERDQAVAMVRELHTDRTRPVPPPPPPAPEPEGMPLPPVVQEALNRLSRGVSRRARAFVERSARHHLASGMPEGDVAMYVEFGDGDE